MKILVLGGTRFFGKHLVRALLAAGHEVTIATRGQAGEDFDGRTGRLIIERTDPECLKRVIGITHYDVIFDNIAYCSNDVKNILDAADCDRYIMTSTTAVYHKHMDTRESDFDPLTKELVWCNRPEVSYDEGKRLAECALFTRYSHIKAAAVRYPFVIGTDDYTGRLAFYVRHILEGKPMYVDHFDAELAFVRSDEAGAFLAFLAESGFCGQINGSSSQTVSVHEIADYVEKKTGKSVLLARDGDPAPYNGEQSYTINTERAEGLGFHFTPLREWIYGLIDHYISCGEA